jgi:hypothetical protein
MISVRKSKNAKLGLIAATYRQVGPNCPQSCPALGRWCYAMRGYVGMIQARASDVRRSLRAGFDALDGVKVVRHLVSGDAFRQDGRSARHGGNRTIFDRQYVRELFAFHKRNPSTVGWGYTHDADAWDTAGCGPETFPDGLEFLASCDTKREAKRLRAAGWRTARVTERLDRDKCEIYCPIDLAKHRGAEVKTDCDQCRLCPDAEKAGGKSIIFLKT